MTQGYAHVLMHEMGHALGCKLITGLNPEIYVIKKDCTGFVTPCDDPKHGNWKNTAILVMGPISNIAFSSCKLTTAIALKNIITKPVALVLATGSVVRISGEVFYACTSIHNRNSGDFGKISSFGYPYLMVATMVMASQVALGVF